MSETQILNWFHATALGHLMETVPLLFSIFQTFHFIGLCLLLGALLVVDLRLLGVMTVMSIKTAFKFLPIGLAGFAINAVTGLGFFTFDPVRYWTNWMFQLKMALIVLAGLNALWFTLVEQNRVTALAPGADVGVKTKATATLSLILWVLVIWAGRLLPVTQTAGNG